MHRYAQGLAKVLEARETNKVILPVHWQLSRPVSYAATRRGAKMTEPSWARWRAKSN